MRRLKKNKTIYFMLLCILVVFVSCRRHPSLSKAEQLINTNPDSALLLLRSLNDPGNMSQKDYAHWCLLMTKAKAKNSQSLIPDSFIFRALDYFKDHPQDSLLTAEAYFYAAQVNKEIKNIEEATQYFLKAKDFAAGSGNKKLAFWISHNLCDIYSKQGLFKYKLTEAWNAHHYAVASKDSLCLYYALSDLGYAYSTMEKEDSALIYFKEALPIVKKVENKKVSSALNDICYAYINKNDFVSALRVCNEAIACEKDSIDRYNNYINKGVIFYNIQQYDSAIYYFSRSSKNNYIYAKAISYSYLSDIYETKGNLAQALKCMKTYDTLRDSIEEQTQSVAIIEMQNLFQHEKLEKSNRELTQEMEAITSLVYKISLIAAFILLIIGICYFITYKKKTERIHNQEKEITAAKDQLQKQKIESLQKEEKLSSLRADFLRRLVAINIPSLNKNEEKNNIKLSDEDFANLEKDINTTFDNFTLRLSKEYPLLDKEEIQFCCLLKIQLDLSTLSDIYCRSKAAISKRKLRIKLEKIGISDKNCSLDDFIKKF